MSWFGKLFGDGSRQDAEVFHPPLPAGFDRFLPGGARAAFRASVNVAGTDPQSGETIFRAGAGSSLVSQADAEQKAAAAAQRHLRVALIGASDAGGEYAYAVHRRLEPVLETLGQPAAPTAKVTVNSYGAVIVNTAAALFADVDTRADDTAEEDPDASDRAAARLGAAVGADPELGFRVYRTRNGWRYLCTSRLFAPAADETKTLLEELGADTKYVQLCRAQGCFRARLTPKPWRIGARFSGPRPLESVTRKRLERYLKKSAPYATARFASTVGQSATVHPEVSGIIEYHDLWCGAHSDKPLA